MRVYRFMSLRYGLDSLQSKRLRIGRLLELNDPYDCAPRIVNVPSIPAGGEEAFETGYLGRVAEAFGLLSYSATMSDPVIWSHYADSHRGLAFAFDYTEPSDGLIEVNYGAERRTLDYRELEQKKNENALGALQHLISEGFTMKAFSWRYECEYRQFIALDACSPSGEHYFRPFPVERLSAVVLGARCVMREVDIERSLRSSGYPSTISVLRARMHRGNYEIVI